MVSQRRLGIALLLLGLAFVGVLHTVLAFAFDTGLRYVGVGVVAVSLLGLLLVGLSESADDE